MRMKLPPLPVAIAFLSGIGIELVLVDSLEGAVFLEDMRMVAGALHHLTGAKKPAAYSTRPGISR